MHDGVRYAASQAHALKLRLEIKSQENLGAPVSGQATAFRDRLLLLQEHHRVMQHVLEEPSESLGEAGKFSGG